MAMLYLADCRVNILSSKYTEFSRHTWCWTTFTYFLCWTKGRM